MPATTSDEVHGYESNGGGRAAAALAGPAEGEGEGERNISA